MTIGTISAVLVDDAVTERVCSSLPPAVIPESGTVVDPFSLMVWFEIELIAGALLT